MFFFICVAKRAKDSSKGTEKVLHFYYPFSILKNFNEYPL